MINLVITDIYKRKTFDVINIFRYNYSEKINLILCDNINKITTLKLYSGVKIYPLNVESLDGFVRDLSKIEALFDNLVFLPLEEYVIKFFYKYQEICVNTKIKYLLPSEANFTISRDKELLYQFCCQENIRMPKHYSFDDLLAKDFNFVPLIIKPRIGSGARGISHIEKIEMLRAFNFEEDDIIQEKIGPKGDVFGAFFLFENGRYIDYYGHKRISTFPEKGGVTIYSELQNHEVLKNRGIEILSKLEWSGIAMLEFMYDKNGFPTLIEINPRIWGSIILSEFARTNFLINYVNVAVGNPPVNSEIRNNTAVIWFFPYGIWITLKVAVGRLIKRNKIDTSLCYINWTYSNFGSTFLFISNSIFDWRNIKRYFESKI